jgi:hypothetical protein
MAHLPKIIFSLLAALLALSCAASTAAQKKKKKKSAADSNLSACLPPDVKPNEILAYSLNRAKDRTVLDELKQIKARCAKGRLSAPDKREIRFFRPSCWGNPPLDAQEILANEAKKLETLKKSYRVVIFQCSPMTQ